MVSPHGVRESKKNIPVGLGQVLLYARASWRVHLYTHTHIEDPLLPSLLPHPLSGPCISQIPLSLSALTSSIPCLSFFPPVSFQNETPLLSPALVGGSLLFLPEPFPLCLWHLLLFLSPQSAPFHSWETRSTVMVLWDCNCNSWEVEAGVLLIGVS